LCRVHQTPRGEFDGRDLRDNAAFDIEIESLTAAAQILGCQLSIFNASNEQEIRFVFQSAAQQRLAALIVSTNASFSVYTELIVALAVRIPTMTTTRSDGWRPPVPIDDDTGGAEYEGAVRCIC
jgi:DNA-binding LacI/PurR family transcriptional regulator